MSQVEKSLNNPLALFKENSNIALVLGIKAPKADALAEELHCLEKKLAELHRELAIKKTELAIKKAEIMGLTIDLEHAIVQLQRLAH